MYVESALKTDSLFPEASKPGMCPLDDPAVSTQAFFTFDTFASDARCDAAFSQKPSASGIVVALVGMQFAGALPWPSIQSRHGRDSIQCALECYRIMPVCPCDRDCQRNASCINDDVPFAAQFSTIGWVWASFLPPRGLATLAPSILARLQSSWSCSRNLLSIARCSFSQTPAACQSRSRRQQVIPLPKPSSCGKSSHGMPVWRTYKIPFKAASSLTERRRPPFREGENAGIKGSSAVHNSLLTFLLAIAEHGLPSSCVRGS